MREGNDFIVVSIASFTSFDESRISSPYIFYKTNFCNYFAIVKGSWFLYVRKIKIWWENLFEKFSFSQKHIKVLHSFHFLRKSFGFVLETDPLVGSNQNIEILKKIKNWQNLCKKVKMESKLKYLEKYGFSTDDNGDKKKKKKKKSKVKDVGG